jgi:hypothetical protein
VVTTGLCLLSFRGHRARITQRVLSPGNKDKVRLRTTFLTHEDHGNDIAFNVTNYGRIPVTVSYGDCIGQIILIGVDDVECEVLDVDNTRVCLDTPACARRLLLKLFTVISTTQHRTRNLGLVTRVRGDPLRDYPHARTN